MDGEENMEHVEEGVRDDDDKEGEEEDVLDENEENEGPNTQRGWECEKKYFNNSVCLQVGTPYPLFIQYESPPVN